MAARKRLSQENHECAGSMGTTVKTLEHRKEEKEEGESTVGRRKGKGVSRAEHLHA